VRNHFALLSTNGSNFDPTERLNSQFGSGVKNSFIPLSSPSSFLENIKAGRRETLFFLR
jgi:hypothetical protein